MGIDAELYVRTRETFTDEDILAMAYDLAEAFGPDHFFIKREGDEWQPAHHCLTRVDHIEQDSAEEPDLPTKPGETILRCHLRTRYYGPGYERGDFGLIYLVAKWLEERTDGEPWYGGDSSGVLIKPFGPLERERLLAHFIEHGRKPYRGEPGDDALTRSMLGFPARTAHEQGEPAPCSLCRRRYIRSGWGPLFAAYACHGCGHRLETQDGGVTWQEPKETD